MQEPFGFYWTTVDSGNHWRREVFANGVSCRSYGDSTFRLFSMPNEIFTTHNNWSTWDTTRISVGSLLTDTSFHPYDLFLGSGDTLAIEGWRWKDLSDYQASVAMALSTDFGEHWAELSIPHDNGIYFAVTALQAPLDWNHMVIAGNDSVGRIVQSFDGGMHWECDTVSLSTGISYHSIMPFTVTGSGRVLAGVAGNGDFIGSSSLAYLERVPAAVTSTPQNITTILFPNPTTSVLDISSIKGNISILDLLSRSYGVQRSGNTLDVSGLPPGTYFVSDGNSRLKFVKE